MMTPINNMIINEAQMIMITINYNVSHSYLIYFQIIKENEIGLKNSLFIKKNYFFTSIVCPEVPATNFSHEQISF